MMWQVTCECGWRVKGAKDEIVAKVQEHGRTAHGRELTEDEVLAIAIPVEQAQA
jgi:predicted small metal-binding protein